MANVGIFGGSFDPPHIAHLIIAEQAREQLGLDWIYWIPSYRPPHKDAACLSDFEHRVSMVELAISNNPHFRVSRIEETLVGPGYTVNLVQALHEREPEHRFVLLIGGDSYAALPTWYRPDLLFDLVELAVYDRPGAQSLQIRYEGARVRFLNAPLLEVSATAIRKAVADGKSIRYLVPDAVAEYIEDLGLYKASYQHG